MAIRDIITANCENGQLSKSKIARQWDDQGTLIQFAGYPEPETDEELIFHLIVWMRASEDVEPVELPPIELEADQWLISNYYTQLPQMLRFQLCIANEAGTYEKHSPIFSGIVDKSLSHNGEGAEIDVIPLFDPYKNYLDELILDAGARVVDTELDETSTHLVENKAVAEAVAAVNGRLDALNELLSAYEISPNFNNGFIKYDTLEYGTGGTHQYSDVVLIPAMSLVYVPRISKSSSTSLLTLCNSEGNPVQCLIRGTTTAQSTGDFFIYPFVEDSYVRFGGNTAMSDYMRYYRKKFDEDYVVDVDSFRLLNPYNFDHSAGAIKEAGVVTAAEYEYLANIALPKGMTIEFYGCAGAGVATLSEFSQTFTIQQILVAGTGFIQHEQYTANSHMLVRLCARVRPTETAFSVVLPEEKLFGWKIYYKPFHFKENKNSPLYQKKLTVIGDSLIHGNVLGNGSTWVTNVGIKYNMVYVNLGDNGNPVATVDDSGEVAMVDRITDVPTDTDIFVLLGGANDKRFNVPLGEIDSTNKYTFYGALNTIISAVYARCPKAKILLMTTYCRYTSKNSLDLGDEDYANAMLEAGRHNLVPVFDNYHNSGVNFLNANQLAWIDESRNRQKKVNDQTTYIDPTHHFSVEGYEWLTSIYEAALSAI